MQRVFITGASSGLGQALARRYAAQGAVLGLVGRRQDALELLRSQLPGSGHHVYALDVTDYVALHSAAQDFIAAEGGADIVIASAGISRGTLTEFAEDLPVFERVMQTNVTAMVATFIPFIETMRDDTKTRPVRLVGIASVAGMRGLPGAEAYSASKSAVISYCESLRVELRKTGIRVVTIVPGYIDTPMTQVNTYAMPFLMPAEKFAQKAAAAIAAGSSYRVIPWQMGWVAKLLRLLPNWLYDLVFSNAPHKTRAGNADEHHGVQ